MKKIKKNPLMPDFHLLIAVWYRQNKRDLPWRDTKNAYFIWLSEVILQQTRVNQGLNYYLKFINNYPTVRHLANANEQDVLKDWQGLGYYSRARNLHKAAKQVCEDFDGSFPSSFKELKKLKGVGDYTAAAIASFAFNEAVAVVDGNVYRVLSRVFDIDTPIDSSDGKKLFQELANSLIDQENPGEFNQALMEIGALQCVPQNPSCEICPLQVKCLSYTNQTVQQRPVKLGKTKVRNRYFHYLYFFELEKTILIKRIGKDIWQHLYEFPMIETESNEEISTLIEEKFAVKPNYVSPERIHILSHQKIHARFYHIPILPAQHQLDESWNIILQEEIQNFPLPRLIDRYLEKS
jgi:A/G-specific adenine glycosylase